MFVRFFATFLLTTFFVSAMPLHAAYTQQPTAPTTLLGNLVNNVDDEKSSCESSVGSILSEEAYKTIEGNGGYINDYQHERAEQFLAGMTADFGPPPFEVDEWVVAKISSDADTTYLFAFSKGCMTWEQLVPTDAVEKFVTKIFGEHI